MSAQYPDFDTFSKKFTVSDKLLSLLISEGEKAKIEVVEEELEISKELINEQLKALTARDLFETSEYYQIINQISPAYNKAIEIIESSGDYSDLLK